MRYEEWMSYHGPRHPMPTLPVDLAVVSRRVGLAPALLEVLFDDAVLCDRLALVDLGDLGSLRMEHPIGPTRALVPTWGGRARLRRRGRHSRSVAVTIEVSAWSAGAAQLRVSPVAVRPWRWGQRRLRRYFELAHAAADELVRLLAMPAPGEPHPEHALRARGRPQCEEPVVGADHGVRCERSVERGSRAMSGWWNALLRLREAPAG